MYKRQPSTNQLLVVCCVGNTVDWESLGLPMGFSEQALITVNTLSVRKSLQVFDIFRMVICVVPKDWLLVI